MNVIEAIKGRRSIRTFQDKEISNKQIQEIIRCGTYAPSAGNVQPWEFVIVTDRKQKEALAQAALGQDFIIQAPVVLVVLADKSRSGSVYGSRGVNLYSIQDTAAAIQNILLATYSMGLGACWIGAFNDDKVNEIVRAGNYTQAVAIIPIGYPTNYLSATPKRKLEDVIHEGFYKK
ncbi:nitroreductase family protein [[Eubacterium] cellulosolvens]